MVRGNWLAVAVVAACSLFLFGCPPNGQKTAPTASFTAQTTLGVGPLAVQFTDTSAAGTAAITQWAWAFGDGATSSQQNPSHTYAQTGTYTVSLEVTTADGTDTETRTQYITVASASDLPVASFTVSEDAGTPPMAVQFTDTSTAAAYSITGWLWSFGDGATSTEQHPSHTYAAIGYYDVSLQVTSSLGSDTATQTSCVTVAPDEEPHAEFSADTTDGFAPLTVHFADQSVSVGAPITERFWVFGVEATSTATNPTHVYTTPGIYNVTLTVRTAYHEDQIMKSEYITVRQPLAPVAAFTSEMVQVGSLEVAFTDTTNPRTAAVTQWAWDFGDGATSTVQNPHHTYAAEGTYSATLTTTSAHGSDSVTRQVVVDLPDPPAAAFSATPTDGLAPLFVTFTDTSDPGSAPITAWLWTFGDGATSTDQNTTHSYTAEGVYTVKLQVTSQYGTSEVAGTVDVHAPVPPTADFSMSPQSGSEPLLVKFKDKSDPGSAAITAWAWTFGDGGTSNTQNPEHTYTTPGTYDVSLQVTTDYGSDTESKTGAVTVYEVTVRINELLSANDTGLTDEDGDHSDWIEIYNPKGVAVDLAGYTLSDDSADPSKWAFPSVSIPAGGYLIVFASGKDRAPTSGELHTNFKLNNEGEYLALFANPAEPAISEFSPKYPDQRSDYSYGMSASGPDYLYFETPTPGAANSGTTYLGISAVPEFDHPRGFYAAGFNEVLTTSTPDAVIRYTTDGTEPSASYGMTYTAPIQVSGNMVIRAMTYKAGYLDSRIKSDTFVINADPALKTLPTISLVLDEYATFYGPDGIMYQKGGYWKGSLSSPDSIKWDFRAGYSPYVPWNLNLATADYNHFLRYHKDPGNPFPVYATYPGNRPWERPASVEVIDPNLDPLTSDAGDQADCGITIHGGDSIRGKYVVLGDTGHPFTQYFTGPDWMYHFAFKKSFRLYFRDEYKDSSFKTNIFADNRIERVRALVLRGGHNDWVNPFIKDEFLRRIQGDAGHPYSRGALANIYVNGVWKGYYNVVDQLNENFFQEWYGSTEDWDVLTHNWWNPDTYEALLGDAHPVRSGDDVAWTDLLDYVTSHDLTIDANYQTVATKMDMTDFVDYLIIQLYAADYDWLHTNWIVAREKSAAGKFTFYIWDAEKTMRAGDVDGGLNFNGFYKNGDWAKNPLRGGLNGQTAETTTDSFGNTIKNESYAPISVLYVALKNNATFKQLWRDRVNVLFGTGGALSKANLTARFTELRDELNPMIKYAYDHTGGPYIPSNSMDEFILTDWIPQREAIVKQMFVDEGF